MASEMVEKVARAICCRDGCQAQEDYDPIKGRVGICQAHTFEKDARAAIDAMREPTEAMELAGRNYHGSLWDPDEDSVGLIYAHMIDAALKD